MGPQKRLWTELYPDTFHWGPSPWAVAVGCGEGMEEGGRGMGRVGVGEEVPGVARAGRQASPFW